MMEPVFPNSAFVRAPERLVLKGGAWKRIDIKVRYALWSHPSAGVVLVDTGYGRRVTEGGDRGVALKTYAALFGPRLVETGSVASELSARGKTAADVGAIVVSHFHADHISALRDFPSARFFASGAAWDRVRRTPAPLLALNGIFPELLPDDFETRLVRIEDQPVSTLPNGLGGGRDLFGDGSLLAVPLPGHAPGHFGVLWPEASPPLLYAVDTQWLWLAIAEDRAPSGPARLIFDDWAVARASTDRVRRFARAGGQIVLCHDPGADRHAAPPGHAPNDTES